MDEVYIVGAARTPMGGFQGAFADTTAPVLGGTALAASLAQSGVKPGAVEELVMAASFLPARDRPRRGRPDSRPASARTSPPRR